MALSRSLTPQEIGQFLAFAEEELLPRGEYSSVQRQEGSFPMAVLTADVEEDGSTSDDMFAGENVVGFRSFEYRGWRHFAGGIERRFNLIRPFLESCHLSVKSVGLEVEDRFFSDEREGDLALEEVFNLDGPYMVPALAAVRPVWDSNLQWFTDDGDFTFMEVLRLDCAPVKIEPSEAESVEPMGAKDESTDRMDEWRLLTKIMHRQHFFSRDSQDLCGKVREALDTLHSRNKRLLLQTLSSEMIHQIGLKEGE